MGLNKTERVMFVITILIFASILGGIVGGIGFEIVNEGKRISAGVVVDKEYYPGYNHSSVRTDSNGKTNYSRDNAPPQYKFCIEGEKNGEIVRYWFDVTQAEYERYSVGDTYSR